MNNWDDGGYWWWWEPRPRLEGPVEDFALVLIGLVILFYFFIVRPVQKENQGTGKKPLKDRFFNLILLSVILYLSVVPVAGKMPFIAISFFYISLPMLAVSTIGFSVLREIEKNPSATKLTLFGVGARILSLLLLLDNILLYSWGITFWVSLMIFVASIITIYLSKHYESKKH